MDCKLTISSDEEYGNYDFTEILIGGMYLIRLSIAADDFNDKKRSLFATMIWNGAKVLAEFLSEDFNVKKFIRRKSIIEFGAAAGLPSIACYKMGAACVCASDYPSSSVIVNLSDNITRNTNNSTAVEAYSKIGCISYSWGSNVDELVAFNNGTLYDVVIASECLWHHESHGIFLQSVAGVLRDNGTFILSYSHHIPGIESADDAFFAEAVRHGFAVANRRTVLSKHMWSEKEVEIYIVELILHKTLL